MTAAEPVPIADTSKVLSVQNLVKYFELKQSFFAMGAPPLTVKAID